MIKRSIQIMAFFIPAVGMIAGLAAAPMITAMLLLIVINTWRHHRTQCHFYKIGGLSKSIILFLSFAFCSCFWSPYIVSSILLWAQISCLILMLLFVISQKSHVEIIMPSLVYGILTAIVLFYIEYFTDGIISRNVRIIVQEKGHHGFALSLLDRGCALLAVYAWIAIGYIFKRSKLAAVLLYLVTLLTLSTSDSTSGFVAFILASIACIMLYCSNMKLVRLMTVGLLAATVMMPIFAHQEDPLILSDRYLGSKLSWQHRLFIWDFVADKAMEKPIFGHGFNSSRYLGDDKVVIYQNTVLPILPLHPHNNILQIWLEMGCIGLALFALMLTRITSKIQYFTGISAPLASACLISYFIIGMISFNIWQLWWVCTGIFAIYMIVGNEELKRNEVNDSVDFAR